MIKLFCTKSILFSRKLNASNFSNFTFSNTFISDILLLHKFNSINSLKFTFSNILISDILLKSNTNFSNFSNLAFPNSSIFDILLDSKFNSFNSLNSILNKSLIPLFPRGYIRALNSLIFVFGIFNLYFILNSCINFSLIL